MYECQALLFQEHYCFNMLYGAGVELMIPVKVQLVERNDTTIAPDDMDSCCLNIDLFMNQRQTRNSALSGCRPFQHIYAIPTYNLVPSYTYMLKNPHMSERLCNPWSHCDPIRNVLRRHNETCLPVQNAAYPHS